MFDAVPLVPPVSLSDHARGNRRAPVTLVEFGDYECRFSRRAAPILRELLARFGGSLCLVYRHAPRAPGLEHASLSALAAEAAAVQGRFWEMHDLLYEGPEPFTEESLWINARKIGLDFSRFDEDRRSTELHRRLYELAGSAARSGVVGTPMFFLNGHRYTGTLDLESLSAAVARALDEAREGREVTVASGLGRYGQTVHVGAHRLVADLPVQDEGEDAGPSPMEMLLASLGADTSLVVESYARRKSIPLEKVTVRLRKNEGPGGLEVRRTIVLAGSLTEGQREALSEAAESSSLALLLKRGGRLVTRVTVAPTGGDQRSAQA